MPHFSVTEQCDWPESVDCQYTTASLAKFKLNEPTTIYLTFDDGPGMLVWCDRSLMTTNVYVYLTLL